MERVIILSLYFGEFLQIYTSMHQNEYIKHFYHPRKLQVLYPNQSTSQFYLPCLPPLLQSQGTTDVFSVSRLLLSFQGFI